MVLGRLPMEAASLRRLAASDAGVASDAARVGLAALELPGGAISPDDGPLIRGSLIDPPILVRDITETLAGRSLPGGQPHP